jgi:hypothetical protein
MQRLGCTAYAFLPKGRTIRKVMGRVGKKTEKNPSKQKGFEKKYMHQTCLKCEKTYF